MDVAYIGQVDNQETIINRRNISVGIGCECRVDDLVRVEQENPFILEV